MGRSPCCSKEGLNRGAWTAKEDKILSSYIKVHGEGKWRSLPKRAGLKRCGKSCRLRWLNYLRPDIKRGNITADEEELIIRLHNLLGNRWSLIAGRLPGRTDNEIKNYWNTNICKKMQSKSNHSTQDKPMTSIAQQLNDQGNSNSTLVRTKASRCTKVVIVDPVKYSVRPGHQCASNVIDGDEYLESQLESKSDSRINYLQIENEPPMNFMMNIELDDKLLSDFFNEDQFSPLDCYINSEGNCGLSPKNSDQALINFPNDIRFHNCDSGSMSYALLEPDLDWFDQ
ncbi:hypothetical protein ACFE04_003942 [Oxalis oulophora]